MSEFTPREFRAFRALGLGFSAWVRNFIPITVLAAVLYTPVFIWIGSAEPENVSSLEELQTLIRNYFIIPVSVLIGLAALLVPLVTYRIVKHLSGTTVSIMTSMRYGVRGFVPGLILTGLNIGLAYIPMGNLIMMILLTHWFVASPAAVAEKLGPIAAFQRSSQLTSGRRWGIFGVCFLIGLVLVAVIQGYIIPTLKDATPATWADTLMKGTMVTAAVIAIYSTYLGIVQAVSYALLRQEKDGVSHEELARVFE